MAKRLPFESVDFYTERLLKFLRSLSPRDWYNGSVWYPNALTIAEDISYGLPVERVAGCISALSPNTRWEKNVTWARIFTFSYAHHLPLPALHTHQFRNLAWNILRTGNVQLNGNKTRNFYHAILGDLNAVTIDSHMLYIFLGYEKKLHTPQYNKLAQAVHNCASYYNLAASVIQAGAWGKMRELKPKRFGGYFPWWEML